MKENKQINKLLEELNRISELENLGYTQETIEAFEHSFYHKENLIKID